MTETPDEKLIDHIAERLYWHRFADPRLSRSKGWETCKLTEPSFAACYLDSAAVALEAFRNFDQRGH